MVKKEFLLRALLQHNYFPFQRSDREEMPPIFCSERFTPDIARELVSLESKKREQIGYDWLEYRSTRFSNVSRSLAIPHPLGYAALVLTLYKYWDKIYPKIRSKNSLVTPKTHTDGRVVIMNYERGTDKALREMQARFGKGFTVQADIANFYPSIYSHSIPWALVGFEKAKQIRKKDCWFNEIDHRVQCPKRKETNGVPIGPGTSNIIAEIILARVDEELRKNGFEFVRYIDDYIAFCATYNDAEKFLLSLSESLGKYKLFLNEQKTSILALPTPLSDGWVADLNTRHPRPLKTPIQAVRFLDYALYKQEQTPQGSVLKYAVKSILQEAGGEVAKAILSYIFYLSMYYPVLIPLIDPLVNKLEISHFSKFPYSEKFLMLLERHVQYRRSDASTWLLYYIYRFQISIPEKLIEKLLATKDCLPILMLYYAYPGSRDKIINFARYRIKHGERYDLDTCWILLYQLFYENKIDNPYKRFKNDALAFDLLKSKGVSFMRTCSSH